MDGQDHGVIQQPASVSRGQITRVRMTIGENHGRRMSQAPEQPRAPREEEDGEGKVAHRRSRPTSLPGAGSGCWGPFGADLDPRIPGRTEKRRGQTHEVRNRVSLKASHADGRLGRR